MTKISKLPKISILIWVLWPAVFAMVFSSEFDEFLVNVLGQYFYYPPALDNIVNFWLKAGPAWKRIYVNLWFINGVIIALNWVVWLRSNSWHLRNVEEENSLIKMILYGVSSFLLSIVIFSEIAFDPSRQLSDKSSFIINNGGGLLLVMPILLTGAACAQVVAICCAIVVVKKLFRFLRGDSK